MPPHDECLLVSPPANESPYAFQYTDNLMKSWQDPSPSSVSSVCCIFSCSPLTHKVSMLKLYVVHSQVFQFLNLLTKHTYEK